MSKPEYRGCGSDIEFVVQSCCRSAPVRATFFGPPDERIFAGDIVRPAEKADLIPDPEVAYHESGHAIVGLLFGMEPESVVAGAGGYVRWNSSAPSRRAEILMTLAGDFAGGIYHRAEYRPYTEELLPWLALIRQPAGGFCDRCRIVRSLVVEHGVTAPDEAILSAYRLHEVEALAILRRNDVRAALRALVDALMKTGRLAGETATAIASRFIRPGELKE